MLLIRCPWCGERAQTEFTYVGDRIKTRKTRISRSTTTTQGTLLRMLGRRCTEHWP